MKLLLPLPVLLPNDVSLFTREWIEIGDDVAPYFGVGCLPLYEGVD